MQASSGYQLDNIHDLFPLLKCIKIGRHGSAVMGEGGKGDQVIADPEKLGEHHPDELSPIRYLDAGKGFHRQEIGKIIAHTA